MNELRREENKIQQVYKLLISVPGCYYNGTVYKLGEFWLEENQGDKHLVQNVTMECVRSESGYFDKKVTGSFRKTVCSTFVLL